MEKNAKGKNVGLSLVYPPPHLYQILFELFKNSMRATVEIHGKSHKLPMIEVLVAKAEHDVSIRLSDQIRPSCTLGMDILCAGWRCPPQYHRPFVPLSLLHGTQTIYDTNQGTTGWLWLWPPPLQVICQVFPRRPHHQLL